MTPRERVKAMLSIPWYPEPYGKRSFITHDELEARIETAIIRAIEEEREACAFLAREQRDACKRVNGALAGIHCSEVIEERIRARSKKD